METCVGISQILLSSNNDQCFDGDIGMIRRIIKQLSDAFEAFQRHKLDDEFINSSPGSGPGGENSDDGGGELHFHSIQIDHDPVPSIEMIPSPALNDSFASNQIADEQPPPPPPPPPRSPSHIESQTASITVGPDFNVFGLAKTFLVVAAEVGLAALAIWFSAGESLAPVAKILLYSAAICSVTGFLCCSCGYILQLVVNDTAAESELIISRKAALAARRVTGVGGAATACGFVCCMGTLLPVNLMLGVTAVICIIPISAFGFAFKKRSFITSIF